MSRAVVGFAATVEGGGAAARDEFVDANRLRRMDRFGRSGVLAGARVLSAAGISSAAAGAAPDPRFGVVVGTAFGCRDAINRHERLLAAAARVEDLAPSVFAATVHNTVAGELAIGWGLGGPAETLVSGRTAGLEALVLAASRVARGDADRILVVAAEGIDDGMREAFERENPGSRLVESSAGVLVERREDEISLSEREEGKADLVDSALTFDADAPRVGAPPTERLGAAGLWEIARDLAEPHSPSRKIRNRRYEVRDVHGSCATVTLTFSS